MANTDLLGILKVWGFQFALLLHLVANHHVRGHTMPCQVVEEIGEYTFKPVVGLTQVLDFMGLYGNIKPHGRIHMHQSKVGNNKDFIVEDSRIILKTGRKWNPASTVTEAKAALKHIDIVDPACYVCTVPATLKHIPMDQLGTGEIHLVPQMMFGISAGGQKNCAQCNSPKGQPTIPHFTSFVLGGKKQTKSSHQPACLLTKARDWEMHVDLHQRRIFSQKVAQTNLCPDWVLWSSSCRYVLIVELTFSWEVSIYETFERKRLQYADLAVEAAGQDERLLCARWK